MKWEKQEMFQLYTDFIRCQKKCACLCKTQSVKGGYWVQRSNIDGKEGQKTQKESLTPRTPFLKGSGSVTVLSGSIAALTRFMWSLSPARKTHPPARLRLSKQSRWARQRSLCGLWHHRLDILKNYTSERTWDSVAKKRGGVRCGWSKRLSGGGGGLYGL